MPCPCCTPTRGELINRRAFAGSQVVTLRARIPELEKLSRRTPPRHLVAERRRVADAELDLFACKAQLGFWEKEWADLKTRLNESVGPKEG